MIFSPLKSKSKPKKSKVKGSSRAKSRSGISSAISNQFYSFETSFNYCKKATSVQWNLQGREMIVDNGRTTHTPHDSHVNWYWVQDVLRWCWCKSQRRRSTQNIYLGNCSTDFRPICIPCDIWIAGKMVRRKGGCRLLPVLMIFVLVVLLPAATATFWTRTSLNVTKSCIYCDPIPVCIFNHFSTVEIVNQLM